MHVDFDTFKKQLDAARQAKFRVNGAEFTLTLPTDYDMAIAAEDCRDAQWRVNNTRAMRIVLMQAVRGWEGVKASDVIPDAPAEPLEFSFAALGALLDHRRDITVDLTRQLTAAREERLAQREQSEKN
jgi:hypothetical protein